MGSEANWRARDTNEHAEIIKRWTNKSQVAFCEAQAPLLNDEKALKYLEAIYYEMRRTNAILMGPLSAAQAPEGEEAAGE